MNVPFLSLEDITAKYKDEIHDAVLRVVDGGWYLHGEETEKFEKDYSRYIGSRYCIGCANGLDSLTLIFRAYIELNVLKSGDEVIVPANTYIATVLALTENGLIPIFVESDATSLEMDDMQIESKITDRTKAVVVVHLYGRLAYTAKVGQLCNKYNLLLVEDNAQSHGCEWNGKKTGAIGNAAGHSFYPGKNLGALGDAGAVTTNDGQLAECVRALANYGGLIKYVFKYAGRNSRLDEIQAAVLDVKLHHLDEDITLRQNVAGLYYKYLSNASIMLPRHLPDENNVYHLFPILVLNGRRDDLKDYLADKGIGTVIHYPVPPHCQECYSNQRWNVPRISLPITENIAAQELSLPISPCLSKSQVEYVIQCVNDF